MSGSIEGATPGRQTGNLAARWVGVLGSFLVSAAVSGCASPVMDRPAGEICLRASECAPGLACVEGFCSSDLGAIGGILPNLDGGAVADGSTDGALADASMDSAAIDSGSLDSGSLDSGPRDSGPADTGPADTGPADTGPADTGPADTGVMDSGPADTGPADTGVMDSGPVDSSTAG